MKTVEITVQTGKEEKPGSAAAKAADGVAPAAEMDRCCEPESCAKCSRDCCGCMMCVVKSWSCFLNSIECCCVGCSDSCLCFSAAALGCKACLEEMDCDGH